MTGSSNPEAAERFIAMLTAPAQRNAWLSLGFEAHRPRLIAATSRPHEEEEQKARRMGERLWSTQRSLHHIHNNDKSQQ